MVCVLRRNFYLNALIMGAKHSKSMPNEVKPLASNMVETPPSNVVEQLTREGEEKHKRLRIAVAGSSGVGKSSFINAIRGYECCIRIDWLRVYIIIAFVSIHACIHFLSVCSCVEDRVYLYRYYIIKNKMKQTKSYPTAYFVRIAEVCTYRSYHVIPNTTSIHV